MLVSAGTPTNTSLADRQTYQTRLAAWKSENENSAKESLSDFFNTQPFDFCALSNKLGENLLQKAVLFLERNGKINIGLEEEQGPTKERLAHFNETLVRNKVGQVEQTLLHERMEAIQRTLLLREIKIKEEFAAQGKLNILKI